jgi:hypothetical protein
MNHKDYVHYRCGGMNRGFAPFLPYKAKNGVTFTPTFVPYPKHHEVLYFATSHGVIHPDCGVRWNEDKDSDKRLTKAVKYQPTNSRGVHGFCEFEEYGHEALDAIAETVAKVHKEMSEKLMEELT